MIAFRDPLFDGQLLRTLGHGAYGGAAIGECLAAAAAVANGDRESWYHAWTELAERTFATALTSERGRHGASARSAFLRASNYYRNAYLFHLEPPLDERVVHAYRRQCEAFERAAAWTSPPFERLSIPFEQISMPGWLCPASPTVPAAPANSTALAAPATPASRVPRPVVICVSGYDGTAEESYFWNGAAALARGYHAVIFDGPGQGSLLIEHAIAFRPDWEKAIAAVIDAISERPDVDANRIVVIGESFGGYLAARGAACDGRIAACVLDPAQIGLFQAALARLPLPASWKQGLPHRPAWLVPILRSLPARSARRSSAGWALRRGMLTHGVATPWDYFVDATRYDGKALIGKIRCPTLVCDAEGDDISRFARAFFDELTCEKAYIRFTATEGGAAHCVSGNRPLFHQRVFDWLDDRFGTAATAHTPPL